MRFLISFACAATLTAQSFPRHEFQILGLQHYASTRSRPRYAKEEKGFAAAYVYNGSRISGFRAEFSSTPDRRDGSHRHWALIGGQLKSQRESLRWRPFAHFMAGGVFEKDRAALVSVIGGGLDIKLTRHIDLRVLQAEYAPYRRAGRTFHDGRAAFGLVIH